MPYGELPFGARDAKLFVLTEPATYATGVDFPRIRTVELGIVNDSTELEGDDVRQAVHIFAKRMEGSIESGGINLAALAVLEGGVATTSGTTGVDLKTTYIVRSTQTEKYFKLEAQMYGDDGGDIHLVAYKVKATSGPNYNFTQGEFALLNCDIQAVFNAETPGKLYDLIQYEARTAITP